MSLHAEEIGGYANDAERSAPKPAEPREGPQVPATFVPSGQPGKACPDCGGAGRVLIYDGRGRSREEPCFNCLARGTV